MWRCADILIRRWKKRKQVDGTFGQGCIKNKGQLGVSHTCQPANLRRKQDQEASLSCLLVYIETLPLKQI